MGVVLKDKADKRVLAFFCLFLILNVIFLAAVQDVRAKWANVPPVPQTDKSFSVGVSDKQFAYRMYGLSLQNLGDLGGRSTPLREYNYERLGDWFRFMYALDSRSNYIPFLAAFYFGGPDNIPNMAPVTDFLADIGSDVKDQKWRWLAHAIFLARYKEKNMSKAYDLAVRLAGLYQDGMPAWTKQMPAFVQMAMGDKKAAYGILAGILAGDTSKMHPAEVNFMKLYICEDILDETQALQNPICASIKDRIE